MQAETKNSSGSATRRSMLYSRVDAATMRRCRQADVKPSRERHRTGATAATAAVVLSALSIGISLADSRAYPYTRGPHAQVADRDRRVARASGVREPQC